MSLVRTYASPMIAIVSAVLFGASTPLTKLLLGSGVSPWLAAGLLYLGSGIGLAVLHLSHRIAGRAAAEAPLTAHDAPRLVLVVLAGGIAAPLLLMVGLSRTPAASAALLLNVEGLATMAIAWLVFRENVDRRLLAGAFAILAGALILSWNGAGALGLGALAIVAACIAWGVDNNLTRGVSASDPVVIAMIKGLVAGAVNLTLALMSGSTWPTLPLVAATALVGFAGYGVSLVLFVLALRNLGAARTSAYFSTAPFIGTVLAVSVFGEPMTLQLLFAGLLMGGGVYLHLAERHSHDHTHAELEHDHRHVHDAHHQHVHRAEDPRREPHSHAHRHAAIAHRHSHYPDLHHRHDHAR